MNLFHDATILDSKHKANYDLLEQGTYRMKLRSIEPVEKRPDFNNPGKLQKEYLWMFETVQERTSRAIPYTVIEFCTRSFVAGSPKNKLNTILTGIAGRQLSSDEFRDLDESELFEATLDVLVGVKNKKDGTPMNIIEHISRVKPVGIPPASQSIPSKAAIVALW